jgi:SPP1 gp7 family putative phage head morphogenesis protein
VKTLAPVVHKETYTRAAEIALMEYLDAVIFTPLEALLEARGFGADLDRAEQDERRASLDVLQDAIESGRIWYADGVFGGTFNAAISRELRKLGATPDPEMGTFRLAKDKMPVPLRSAVATTEARVQQVHKDMDTLLGQMAENVAAASPGIDTAALMARMLADLDQQFDKSVKPIEAISISMDLSPEIAEQLRVTLTENMDLYIKGWAQEEIQALRVMVQENAAAGYRADRLARVIAAQKGVSMRKTNFLAAQETSLFTAKYRQARYESVGCTRYKWSTSHDALVRKDHAALDGKFFEWKNPPITNRATGARNNPGEDWRCRCRALPVIETEIASILP